MKRTVRVTAAIAVAVVAQGLLARGLGDVRPFVDLPLVAVIYAALTGGRVAGLLGGTLAGLAQDAVSGGVLGIGGMAKSIAGFLAGIAGTQFIVTQTASRILVFVGATVLNAAVFMGLYAMLGLRQVTHPWLDVILQAGTNGLVGATVFGVIDTLPGARERWRMRREYRQRARFH